MKPTKKHRVLLLVSGLLAIVIGAALLFRPAQFHASNGILIGTDASLLSEIRAPGGGLLVLGLMILFGAFVTAWALASTTIAAAVYLAYGASRLVSIGLDGIPGPGILAATAVELLLGVICTIAVVNLMGRMRVTGHESVRSHLSAHPVRPTCSRHRSTKT